jgi:exopolysaccharide biosynthesis polyprenyl glycosylphosphotransferase
MMFDGIAIFLSMVVSAWIKFDSGLFPASASITNNLIFSGALFSVPFWWLIFAVSGSYRLHWDMSWADEMRLVVKPVTTGLIILFFGAFLVSPSASIGRWIIVFYYGTMLLFVFTARGFTRILERRLAKKGLLVRRAAIVGTGKAAETLENYLTGNATLGYDIVGFIDPEKSDSVKAVPDDRIIGSVKDLSGIIRDFSVLELLVTIASNFHDDILSLLLPATGEGIRVKVVPDLFDVVAGHVHNTQIMGQPFMEILPERLSFRQKLVKLFIDYSLSIIVLVAGLPLWLLIAILIKIDSKGPVFYRQERVGKGCKSFRVFKFRSMVNDAEKRSGPVWAGKNDDRITRLGRFLRKSRIDEIPQLLNVIKGEMSIVGPRPERPVFVEDLKKMYPFYQKRLTIKPGLTGWAQVKLEYDTDMESVAKKLRYDFFYIENQSIFLDLEILARTLKVVLTGAGAH